MRLNEMGEGQGRGPRPRFVSAKELETMSFPPLRAIVPGLIFEGAALLAGAPKLGKSFLMLQLALAVARGEPVLGSGPVEQGDVLYLPLEDGLRRAKRRIRGLLGTETGWPEALALCAEWPRLGEGGVEQLAGWLAAHPAARLVVIDTFQRVRDAGGKYSSAYAEDYEALRPLSPLAEQHRVAIVVVHHTRKLESDDPLDLVNGTVGLTGVVDTALILRRSRGSADASLLVTGRDTEAELALAHEGGTGRWRVAAGDGSAVLSQSRAAILAALREAGTPLRSRQLAEALHEPEVNVRNLLHRMARAGDVQRVDRGRYALSAEVAVDAPPDHNHYERYNVSNRDTNGSGEGDHPALPESPHVMDVIDVIGGVERTPYPPAAAAPAAPSVAPAEPAPSELPCARCGGAIDHFTPEGEPRCERCA